MNHADSPQKAMPFGGCRGVRRMQIHKNVSVCERAPDRHIFANLRMAHCNAQKSTHMTVWVLLKLFILVCTKD